jgi:uncharacterized membrane protein YfcA
LLDWTGLALTFAALFLGGVLKGATGIGAPILAVPLLQSLSGVTPAVVLFSLPNLLTNGYQAWQYRASLAPAGLVWPFAIAGFAGTGIGTLMLVRLPADILLALMAVAVFLFIGFRLARPNLALPMAVGRRIAAPVGLIGGVMFGAVGLSAPVSIPFLSALRLVRPLFVSTISVYFFTLGLMQIPLLIATGTLTPPLALGSLVAVVPLLLGMPLGSYLARFISPRGFDRLTLVILGVMGVRMVVQTLS